MMENAERGASIGGQLADGQGLERAMLGAAGDGGQLAAIVEAQRRALADLTDGMLELEQGYGLPPVPSQSDVPTPTTNLREDIAAHTMAIGELAARVRAFRERIGERQL